jgi:hypothetical protein
MAKFKEGDKAYSFLLDRNVEALVGLFPRGRAKTASRKLIPAPATGEDIARSAWLAQETIVTADSKDFRRAIAKFSGQQHGGECSRMFGLVVLPNVLKTQKRLLKNRVRDLEGLYIGGRQLTWKDVNHQNYEVRVTKTGRTRVMELPLCRECEVDSERKNRQKA